MESESNYGIQIWFNGMTNGNLTRMRVWIGKYHRVSSNMPGWETPINKDNND